MNIGNLLFTIILPSFLSSIESKTCERREECSRQEPGRTCSLCVGEAGSTKCIYPFPELYITNETIDQCDYFYNDCETDKPCKNGGICYDRREERYACECKGHYAGKDCDINNAKTLDFYLIDVDYIAEVQPYDPNDVMIRVNNPLDIVEMQITEGYYAHLKLTVENCKDTCTYDYNGYIRYPYKPYKENQTFEYLKENVLGYFTKLQINAFIKGMNVYKNELGIFVLYPETIICMPIAQLSNCANVNYNATLYKRSSEIRIDSNIIIIPKGNSRYPFTDPPQENCGSVSELNIVWKIWKLKYPHDESDTPNEERLKETTITFKPFLLDFGMYMAFLEAKNVLKSGNSINLATCYFKITSLPLEPIIEGGSRRNVSILAGLFLNAKKSRDPNQPPGSDSIMTKWSCTSNQPDIVTRDMCKPIILKGSKVHYIPPSKLTNGEFNFTLEIWSDLYKDCTHCDEAREHKYAYQAITVSNHSNIFILCQSNCGMKVINSEELVLKVTYDKNINNLPYNWEYMETKNKEILQPPRPAGLPPYIFYLSGSTLQSESAYTVTVSVTINDTYLSATYTFDTDGFNYSGTCLIQPDSGVKGKTAFDISCSNLGNDALLFEFYDKSAEEASENVHFSGRMLGESNTGDLLNLILTRGTVVVYIKNLKRLYIKKTFNVSLSDQDINGDVLLNDTLKTLSYLKSGLSSFLLQYVSYVPDIIRPDMNKAKFLHILIENIFYASISNLADVKMSSLSLYNVLTKLSKDNMDFKMLKLLRTLTNTQSNMLVEKIYNKLMPETITSQDVKEIVQVMLNNAVLSLNITKDSEVYGSSRSIDVRFFFDLKDCSFMLEDTLVNMKRVLSAVQLSALPPTRISSINNTIGVSVIQDDREFKYTLQNMLQTYKEIPVAFSNTLFQRLQRYLKLQDNLALGVTVVNENIFHWFSKDSASNFLFVSLNKRIAGDKLLGIEEITAPLDMEMRIANNSSAEMKETCLSQTTQVDPKLDEEVLDMQIKVHRFDPVPRSLLSIVFLYPPTNATLRVLIEEDYRPTYEMMISRSKLITEQQPNYSPRYKGSNTKSFYYMGVLPGPEIPVNQSVVYSFTVNNTVCQFWSGVKWSSKGCRVGPNTKGDQVHCQCTHLSIFGALFPFLPNQIDPFADAKLFLTVFDNPLVVSIMLTIFIIYVILSIWAYRRDKKDRLCGAINILEDNFPTDKHPYLLAVYTSSRFFAGTSANVGVQLIGELATSRAHILKSKYHKVLSRHSDDWFLMFCSKPLGIIQSLHMWHDHTGRSPDWYCDKIHVYDINGGLEILFIVEEWLELNPVDHPEALVVPATTVDVMNINRVFRDSIVNSLREQRFLLGVFTQHPRSTISRLQRVNIVMCSFVIALLWSIMFYTDLKGKPDEFAYNVGRKDLYVSFFTLAVSVAVNFIICLLFRKSYKFTLIRNPSSLYLRNIEYLKRENQENELPKLKNHPEKNNVKTTIIKIFKKFTKSHKLAPAILLDGDPAIQTKKSWLMIAWAASVVVIVVCIYMIMLYGLKMGLVKSKKWLTSITFSYVEDTVAVNPLTIIAVAVMVTSTFQLTAESSSYRLTRKEIHQAYPVRNKVDYGKLIEKRKLPMYSPMNIEDREIILLKKRIFYNRIKIIQFVLSFYYVVVVFVIMRIIWSSHYYSNSNLTQLITLARTRHNSFYNAVNISEVNEYLQHTFLKALYNSKWYNDWPLSENENTQNRYWSSDYSWKMIGLPLLRQLRVIPKRCHNILMSTNSCIPQWSRYTEDKDIYGIGWSPFELTDTTKGKSPWKYTFPTANWMNTIYRLTGRSGIIYNKGGYLAEIGPFVQEAVGTLTDLVGNSWQNMFTKVLFMELTFCNVNLRILSQITLIVEYFTPKVTLQKINIVSITDSSAIDFWHVAFITLTVIFVLEILYKINRRGLITFFKGVDNIILLIIVVLSFIIIVIYSINLYYCAYYHFKDRYRLKTSFDFDTFFNFYLQISRILGILLLFGACRTVGLFQAENFFTMSYTLFKLSLSTTIFLLLITLLCFIFLWQSFFYLRISTRNSFVGLLTSQTSLDKFQQVEHFTTSIIIQAFVKVFIVVSIASLFITVFVHQHAIARYRTKEENSNVLFSFENELKKIVIFRRAKHKKMLES